MILLITSHLIHIRVSMCKSYILFLFYACNYSYTAEQTSHYRTFIPISSNKLSEHYRENNLCSSIVSLHEEFQQSYPITLLTTVTPYDQSLNEQYVDFDNSTRTQCIEDCSTNNKTDYSFNTKINNFYTCPITSCNKKIRGAEQNLHTHVAIAHYRCYQCGCTQQYTDKNTFIDHLSKHKKYTTSIIKYLSRYKKQQSINSRSTVLDKTERIDKIRCPIQSCHVQLNKVKSLNIHIAVTHNQCKFCNNLPKFSTIQELYNHIVSAHRIRGRFLIAYLSKLNIIDSTNLDLNKKSISNNSSNYDYEQDHTYNSHQKSIIDYLHNNDIESNQFDEIIDYEY